MSFEEMVVAVIAIVGGIGFASFMFWNIFSLVKHWINRKSGSQLDPQFFKALGEFKRNTDRRLANLEAIVSDMEEKRGGIEQSGEHKSMGEIEIEEEEVRSSEEQSSQKNKDDSNLRNMLSE